MTQQKELLASLEGVGYSVLPQKLSRWLHGTHPQPELLQNITQALNLNTMEQNELCRAYVWESRQPSRKKNRS